VPRASAAAKVYIAPMPGVTQMTNAVSRKDTMTILTLP
jgi:hypothetical protein